MATVNEKMTALANEVRELSGTTGKKSIDAMTTDIGEANTATNAYTTKLATLETAITALETELQGKASGGGNVETCTVVINNSAYYSITYYYQLELGQISEAVVSPGSSVTFTAVRGSFVYLYNANNPTQSSGAQAINDLFVITAAPNETAFISILAGGTAPASA